MFSREFLYGYWSAEFYTSFHFLMLYEKRSSFNYSIGSNAHFGIDLVGVTSTIYWERSCVLSGFIQNATANAVCGVGLSKTN